MLKKVFCAVTLLALSLGVAMAEDVKCKIIEIKDGKITVETGKKGETKKVEYTAADNVKVTVTEGDKTETTTLKALASKVGEKGVGAVVTVDGKNVTAIAITKKKKA